MLGVRVDTTKCTMILGMSSVSGSGILPGQTSGSAEWIIVPKPGAVKTNNSESFVVGGFIRYTLDERKHEISLEPNTIEVMALAELHLHYFHEKYVYADNPFTQVLLGNNFTHHTLITQVHHESIHKQRGPDELSS